ncbi:hypothetical protein C1646_771892 [Rhizophagus diaphanus]|nr:hypothetical protein C1646_771892 [Rhizophagus diaphanus] [Rhizophagus sp. MUCL 43196]
MDPTQVPNDSNFYPLPISTSHSSTHQQYDNISVSTQQMTLSYISRPISDYQVPRISSNNSNLNKYSFFYNPPNDIQIYEITCKEINISFELVFELLNGNNDQNNLHEYYFLKVDEKKCYKITCELISHSLIVQYLNNKNIQNIEIKQGTYQQQQEYVEFSRELKQNLENHLYNFFIQHL